MKTKKLLIGTSLITMLTTGAVGAVTPIQNASAHDISANQVSTQYTATDTTQTNTQKTENSEVSSSSKGTAIYQAALSQVGAIQDCTMLVTNALKAVGINYHNWPIGYMSLGTVVSASEAQPGDLIYYANGGTGYAHIAVYAGNGKAVHGGWLGNQTVVDTANVGSGAVYIRVK
ncbi:bifunctional murein DD-endopeptidase/murein LD-carboxypeptidase [Streptococcus sp. UMB1385]|jgi:nlpC/P60 family protein|nr:bifunctional murein DD-endopeptidase/murein LD-carboxypeptidase [Streptococcus sp. UMB1385]